MHFVDSNEVLAREPEQRLYHGLRFVLSELPAQIG